MMMSRELTDRSPRTARLRVDGLSHQAANGNTAAATMLPSETYRVTATMATKSAKTTRIAVGAMLRNAPTAVATPLPPLKRSHTGYMWPRIANNAARAANRYGELGPM